MVGIGYRKDFADEFLDSNILDPDFIEVAPENWIEVGGYWGNLFNKVLEKYPLYLHGLSLSIGSPEGIDFEFLLKVKEFIKKTGAVVYSEHLSFTKCDNAHLYDLLPIPFTEEAIKNVSSKILQVQDFLEQKITMEIASYYTPIAPEMSEIEFVSNVINESDCDLLLDVNNVYVNSFNHKYNAQDYIKALPLNKVSYIHMAGHQKVSDDLIIDTHGQAIIDPVYELFDFTIKLVDQDTPVLLERDFNIPELGELKDEMDHLRKIIIQNRKVKANV